MDRRYRLNSLQIELPFYYKEEKTGYIYNKLAVYYCVLFYIEHSTFNFLILLEGFICSKTKTKQIKQNVYEGKSGKPIQDLSVCCYMIVYRNNSEFNLFNFSGMSLE